MPNPNYPDTPDVLSALVNYKLNMTYVDGTTKVYVQQSQLPPLLQTQFPSGGVQAGQFKDPTDLLLAGGVNAAIGEVYLNEDDSERYVFGGTVRDVQRFFLLTLVSLDNANAAEFLIARVRDANMATLQPHVTLGGTNGNIVSARIMPKSGHYLKVPRASDKEYRAFVYEMEITCDWFSVVGFGA